MVVLQRVSPGIGDAIMMQPLIENLYRDNHKDFGLVTKFPDLFRGMYPIYDTPPEFAEVIDVDDPCPCSLYESEVKVIKKGRTQLFLESGGYTYKKEAPRLELTAVEQGKAEEFKGEQGVQIGLSTTSAAYGNVLDGWRDYPYPEALAKSLSSLGHVVWMHTESLHSKYAEDFKGSLRDLMIRIKSLDIMVAVDTAAVHIAGALGVTVYGLFGPTDPALRIADYTSTFWLPKYEKCGRAYCWYDPCKWRFCLQSLKPKTIQKKVKVLLNG
tara:strand:+ start:4430 stop:5239 length:810 start_codon:yes stop_codon:yes gene_type:complete